MIDCQKIKALAEQQLVGTDVFVVSCKVSPFQRVELLLDAVTSGNSKPAPPSAAPSTENDGRRRRIFAHGGFGSIGGAEMRTAVPPAEIRPSGRVLLLNGTKIRALLDAADAGGITLSYGEAGDRGQKAQAAGEGGQTLRLLRVNNIRRITWISSKTDQNNKNKDNATWII